MTRKQIPNKFQYSNLNNQSHYEYLNFYGNGELFYASPPTPLQLERGALLPGFLGVYQAERFVWFFP